MDDALILQDFLAIKNVPDKVVKMSIVEKVFKKTSCRDSKLKKFLYDEIREISKKTAKITYVKWKRKLDNHSKSIQKNRLLRIRKNVALVQHSNSRSIAVEEPLKILFFMQSKFLKKNIFKKFVWFDVNELSGRPLLLNEFETWILNQCSLLSNELLEIVWTEKLRLQFVKSKKCRKVVDAYLRRTFQDITANTIRYFEIFLNQLVHDKTRPIFATDLLLKNGQFEISLDFNELKEILATISSAIDKTTHKIYENFFPNEKLPLLQAFEKFSNTVNILVDNTKDAVHLTLSDFQTAFDEEFDRSFYTELKTVNFKIERSNDLLFEHIDALTNFITTIKIKQQALHCGLVDISCQNLFSAMINDASNSVTTCSKMLIENQMKVLTDAMTILDGILNATTQGHKDVSEVLERKVYLQEVIRNDLRKLDKLIERSVQQFCQWVDLVEFDSRHYSYAIDVWTLHHKTPHLINDFMRTFLLNQSEHEENLTDLRNEYAKTADEFLGQTKSIGTFVDPSEVAKYYNRLLLWKEQMNELMNKQKHLNTIETALRQVTTKSFKLEKWEENLQHLCELYEEILSYKKLMDNYLNKKHNEVIYADIEQANTNHLEKITMLEKVLTTEYSAKQIITKVRISAEEFRQLLPTLKFMCNSALRDRHWVKMSEITGFDLVPYKEYVLGRFVDLGLEQHLSKLEAISEAANQEYACEIMLEDMQIAWEKITFCFETISLYKLDIVVNWATIFDLLNEHDDIVERILDSPYVEPILEKMKAWESKLVSLRQVLHKWSSTFEQWRKFTKVFASQEAKITLKKEFDSFRTMGKYWKAVINVVKTHSHVIEVLNHVKVLKWLTKCKRLLLFILQGGRRFFGDLRKQCPKLYFASDLQVLDCLSLPETERFSKLLLITFVGLNSIVLRSDSSLLVTTHDGAKFEVGLVHDDEGLFEFLRDFTLTVNRFICKRLNKRKNADPSFLNKTTIKWDTCSKATVLTATCYLSEIEVPPLFLQYPHICDIDVDGLLPFLGCIRLSRAVVILNGSQQSVAKFAILSAAIIHQNCLFIQCSPQTKLEALRNFLKGTIDCAASLCITHSENLSNSDRLQLSTLLININTQNEFKGVLGRIFLTINDKQEATFPLSINNVNFSACNFSAKK